jgi:long-chain acyl-CoA synthetase
VLVDLAVEQPHAIALSDGTRQRTWAELLDRATRLGHLWRTTHGLAAGEHVAALVGNRVEMVEALLASVLSGVWLTPINWHLTAAEVAFIVEDAGARVLLTDPTHHATADEAVALTGADTPVLVAGDQLDALLGEADDTPWPLDGPAGASMIYTSGTTGRPKGVRRAIATSVGAQLRALAAAGRTLGLDGSGPHLVTGPLYHAAPLGFAHMDLHNGAPMHVLPKWDEHQFLALVAAEGIRNTHLVPTMFVRLLRLTEAERAAADVTSLHTVLHGAAPISVAVKQRMIDWWGPVVVEYWGASEGGVVTRCTSQEWLAHPGTVGRAVAPYEVFAADANGQRLGPGDNGELWCRNPDVERVFEYHNDPAKTASAYHSPGTYTIGDIGRVDDEGWVYLADRVSHTIISGGVNIYPAEIEAVLGEHPAIGDAAVFGIPDDEWGEQVKAVVELVEGVEVTGDVLDQLLAHCRRHLAGYKCPKSIDVVDALPRFPTGKLHTRELRDRYWADRDRAI